MKAKKTLSILLTFALILTMLPGGLFPSRAAEYAPSGDEGDSTREAYPLWIGGVQFTSDNLTIDAEDNPAVDPEENPAVSYLYPGITAGKAVYDPETNTLTLTGFKYQGRGNSDTDVPGALSYTGTDALTVVLVGESRLTPVHNNSEFCGMVFKPSEGKTAVTFTSTENGTLVVSGDGITADMSGYGIYAGNADLVISGAVVKAYAEYGSASFGVYCEDCDLTVESGSLTARSNSSGIYVDGGTVTLKEGSLTAEGSGSGIEGSGIGSAAVSVEGGTLLATGEQQAIRNAAFTYSAAVTVRANTDIYGGDDEVDYAASDHDSYKMIRTTAPTSKYPLWIGGVQFDKDDLTIDSTDNPQITAGNAVYDPVGNTLTLTGFTYTGAGSYIESEQGYSALSYTGTEDLTIVVSGENSLTQTGADSHSDGMFFKPSTGSITVTITSADGGELTVTGGKSAGSSSSGITAENTNLVFSGAGVTTIGGEGKGSYGINGRFGDLTVKSGSLTAQGGTAREIQNFGIEWDQGNITLEDGSLTAEGGAYGENGESAGITCIGTVCVKSGILLARGPDRALFAYEGFVLENVSARASVNYDGTGDDVYDPEYHDNYKWIKTEPITAYPLWIGGVQFTSDNLTIDPSDDPDVTAGTAVYDPENHKLTLTGFKYKGAGYTGAYDSAALYYSGTDDLTIILSGENSLTQTGADDGSIGMYFKPSTGKITVTITSTDGGKLTASGGKTTMDSSSGIYAKNADLVFSGVIVKATGREGDGSYGVSCSGCDLTVESGSLTAEAGTASVSDSSGVYSSNGTVTLKDGSLTAVGGTAGPGGRSYGIRGFGSSTSVSVEGGTMLARGQDRAIGYASFTYSEDLKVLASTDYNGTEPGEYDSGNLNNYKWIKATDIAVYPLWIGGVQFTSGNLTIDASDNAAITAGTAVYEPADNKLTLSGFKYNGTGYSFDRGSAVLYYSGTENLEIVLSGISTLTQSTVSSKAGYGMFFQPASGQITVTFKKTDSSAGVRVTGGRSRGTNSYGVYAKNTDLVVNGANLEATGGLAERSSFGIALESSNLTLKIGSVTAISNMSNSKYVCMAIHCKGGTISVEDGTLQARAERNTANNDDHGSFGICGESSGAVRISVSGGKVIAQGDTEGIRYGQIEGSGLTILAGPSASQSSPVSGTGWKNQKYVEIRKAVAYPLWIGGVQFTSDKLTIDASDNAAITAGKAVYDPDNHKLTLTGFKYTGRGSYIETDDGYAALYYTGTDALTIALSGENSLAQTGADFGSDGMCFLPSTGKITVTITSTDGGKLTVTGGKSANYNSHGIYAEKADLIFSGAIVEATGSEALGNSGGIKCRDCDLTVESGSVTAQSGKPTSDAGSYGVYSVHGTIRLVDGSLIAVGDKDCVYSWGITGNSVAVSVEGGTLLARGSRRAINGASFTYSETVKVLASTDYNGTEPGEYDSGNLNNYKWIKATDIAVYPLWIGGVQFTSGNLTIDASDNAAITAGTAVYEPADNKLTLTGFQYEGEGHNDGYDTAALYYTGTDDLTIVLSGENSLTQAGTDDGSIGMLFMSSTGKITVTLTGTENDTLTVIGGKSTNNNSYGIYTENADLVFSGAAVEATGGEGIASSGIYSKCDLTVESGSLTAEAGMASHNNSTGIYISRGTVTVRDGSLTAVGGTAGSSGKSCGIAGFGQNNSAVSVEGGALLARGRDKAIHAASFTYSEDITVLASTDYNGTNPGEYQSANHDNYKWIKTEPITAYPLWIGGVQFTSGNLTIDASDNAAITAGKAVYEPADNKLTLTGFQYEGEGHTDDKNSAALYYSGTDALTIVLSGENSLKHTVVDLYSCGMYFIPSTGKITVTITSTDGGKLTASGGKTTKDSSCGIFAENADLVFSGAAVEATGREGYGSYGICCTDCDLTVESGSLTAESGTASIASSSGVFSSQGTVTLKDGSLTAVGGTAGPSGRSYGICGFGSSTSVSVEGGTMLARGQDRAIGFASFTYSEDLKVLASTDYEGTNPGDYDSGNLDNYKWIKTEPITAYPLWIGGVQFTSGNLTIDSSDDPDITAGTAVYEPADNKLTLTGFQYEGEGHTIGSDSAALYYSGMDALTIVLSGENSLAQTGADSDCYGMFFKPWTGKITVTITSSDGGKLSAESGKSAKSQSHGIYAEKADLIFSGAIVEATGGEARFNSSGIKCQDCGLTVESGSVTAQSGKSMNDAGSSGVYSIRGTIRLVDGSLTAEGYKDCVYSWGISGINAAVSVEGGTLLARGSRRAINGASFTYSENITVLASTDYEGINDVEEYASANLGSYKWIKAADIAVYPLWIGGVQFTSDKLTIDASDNAAITAGKAVYDPDNHKLTLTGFKYTGRGSYIETDDGYAALYYTGTDALTIVLSGENELIQSGSDFDSEGMFFKPSTGKITVTITSTDGGKLSAESGKAKKDLSAGIYAINADLVFSGAIVEATGGEGYINGFGVQCDKCTLTVESGSLTAHGGKSMTDNGTCGIYSYYGTITLKDGSLTADGGKDGTYSWGISGINASMSVEGGTMLLRGVRRAIHNMTFTYTENIEVLASMDYNGTNPGDYDSASLKDYKWIKTESIKAYPLWIGGVQFTSGNLTIDSTDNAEITAGKAVYDPEGHTLALTGFVYEGAGYLFGTDEAALSYTGAEDLTVSVSGKNSVTQTGTEKNSYGMYVYSGTDKITVTITSADGGELTVTGGRSEKAISYGIYASNADLVFSGAVVKATGAEGFGSFGVYSPHCDLTVESGSLTAEAGTASNNSSTGIYLNRGTVTLKDGSLTAVGGTAGPSGTSYGICGFDSTTISVEGGTLLARGKLRAIAWASFTYSENIKVLASTDYDGTEPGDYDSGNLKNYKWIKTMTAPKTGDLTVKKVVYSDLPSDHDADYLFKVTLDDTTTNGTFGDMTFTDGVAEFMLRGGEEATAAGLPLDLGYTVEEVEYDDFTTTSTGDTGTIQAETTATAEFVNTRKTGELSVGKIVVSNFTEDLAFVFTVELGDTSINGVYGSMEFENGVAEFALSDGQFKTASGLPAGITYKVTEKKNEAFTTTATGDTGKIMADQKAEAIFVNTRNPGSLTVSKIVSSELAADTALTFEFRVVLGDTSINGSYGGMTFANGIAEFTLAHGQSLTASDLPAGTTYTVEEKAVEGFTTTSTGASGTISAGAEAKAEFTNTRITYEIKVSAQPQEGGTVSGGGTYEYDKEITVKATPNGGYFFVNWTENGVQADANAEYTFTVTQARELVANFEKMAPALSVTTSVTSTPADGSAYGAGEKIECKITVKNTGNVKLTDITVKDSLTGNTWTIASLAPDKSEEYTASYTVTEQDAQTKVKLESTVTAKGTSPDPNNKEVTATGTYEASLKKPSYEITVSANPKEGGTVTGGGTYEYNKEITVKATPNSGYFFVNWTENGVQADANAEYTFTVTQARELVANFELIPAEAPTISSITGDTVTYGASAASVRVDAKTPDDGYTLSYQWYACDADGSNAQPVGENSDTYEVPNLTDAGTYYFYCEVTAERSDNSLSKMTASAVAAVVIEKRSVILTSESGSKPYDGQPLTKPDVTVGGDGFVEGEVSEIKATGSVTNVAEGEVTNTIIYTEGANFKAGNYEIIKNEGKLSITTASAKITANNNSKVYGTEDPTLTATVEGTVNNESLNYTLSRAEGENVGEYAITVVLGNNPNYEIETLGAIFTITKASATITADDNSKVYGEADPTLTAVVTGTVSGDTLDYTLSRESGEDVGEYTISVELGNNPNYEISTVSGTFTIGTARIVIRAKDQNMILSAPLPRWNSDCYTVTGLLNGDTLDIEPSVRYLYNGVEVPAIRNIGTYEIVPYGAKAGNYAIVYEKGTLTVSYAPYDPADEPSYPPILQPTPGGSVTIDPKAPKAGETVTITPKPDSGNTTAGVTVLDANGNPIQVTPGTDGKYRFTQPAGTATVRVSFERTQGEKNPFVDVFQSDYYYDPVLWAVKNGITAGTTPTTFSPNFACTRAQMVTFLWRASGSPEPKGTNNPFTDVDPNEYYYKAVLWAYETGITSGLTPTTFGPDKTVTRAQMVTFLWRMSGRPEPKSRSNPFTDLDPNEYYYKAVLWAYENGITYGTSETTFSPNDPCTRAQIVAFLFRYFGKK